MADKKISQLTAASTPLTGTEVLPIVQSGSTVKVANNDLRPMQIQSNTTSGVLQVIGPAAASTRVMTTPDANFTVARTDDSQTFAGTQVFNNNVGIGVTPSAWGSNAKAIDTSLFATFSGSSGTQVVANAYFNGSSWIYKNTAAVALYAQNTGVHTWYSAASGTAGNAVSLTQTMLLALNGDLTIAGANATKASGTTWANPSDVRLKDNVQDFTKGLAELEQVNPRIWNYNGKGGTTAGTKGIGVIADEIEKVLPETVDTYKAKLNADDEEYTDIKRFDATEITWLLVNAVKELSAKVKTLETQLATK